MNSTYPYIASLTREPFLFYEMRTTAKLLTCGLSTEDAVAQIAAENLFQYPTEKSITRMAKACVKRLQAMEDEDLIHAIATQPTEIAKQICLYALMKQSPSGLGIYADCHWRKIPIKGQLLWQN